MDGFLFVAFLLLAALFAGLNRRRLSARPGPLMALLLAMAGAIYLFT